MNRNLISGDDPTQPAFAALSPKQRARLQWLEPEVLRILEREGETVLHVALCVTPATVIERALFGSGTAHFKRCALVFTNARIIQVSVRKNLSRRGPVSLISYAAIALWTVSPIRGVMSLVYGSGDRQRFTDLSRADSSAITALLPRLVDLNATPESEGREHLCPACFDLLPPNPSHCPGCSAILITEQSAGAKGWLPAGGYWHQGFQQIAVLVSLVETSLLVWSVLATKLLLSGHSQRDVTIAGCSWLLLILTKRNLNRHSRSLTSEIQVMGEPPRNRVERILETRTRVAADLASGLASGLASQITPMLDRPQDYWEVARSNATDADVAPARPEPSNVEVIHGVPFLSGIAFSDDDPAAAREEQTAIAARIGPILKELLEPDESVAFLDTGSQPFSATDFFSPSVLLMVLVRRCTYAFTTRRIIRVPGVLFGPRRSILMIPYASIKSFKHHSSFTFGTVIHFSLRLILRSGRRVQATGLSFAGSRRLPLLEAFIHASTVRGVVDQSRLCPCCGAQLQNHLSSCKRCYARFRNRPAAIWVSLLAPGGGYFYTGYPIIGILSAAVETVLLFEMLGLASLAMTEGFSALQVGVVAAFALTAQKLVGVSHAAEFSGEFIPLDNTGISPLGGRYLVDK